MPSTSPSAITLPATRLINRVLGDYPAAVERLSAHAPARVDVHVGSFLLAFRITAAGGVTPVGERAANDSGEGADTEAHSAAVTFHIPLSSLRRLVNKDESAYREIAFTGDSELAQVLSSIARQVEWDIEEDISRLLGGGSTADAVAHRLVDGVRQARAAGSDAAQRFHMAEYLLHEREAFIDREALDTLMVDSETLRDDIARLDARVGLLAARAKP
jgi:ubiquinone biosynthesis accessory factor UbiJ